MSSYFSASPLALVLLAAGPAAAASARAPQVEAEPPTTADDQAPPAPADQTPVAPEGLVAPVLLAPVEIEYPAELTKLQPPPSGKVVIRFVVGVDGNTREAAVVESVHPQIDTAALEAVAGLRYTPATFEGENVELELSMAIDVEAPAEVAPEPAEVASEPEPEPEPELEPEPGPRPQIRLRGTVREAGQRTPLKGATVLAIPAGEMKPGRVPYRHRKPPKTEPEWTIADTTDAQGRFALADVPPGRARVIVLTQGFERYEYVLEIREGEVAEVTWFQTRMSTNPFRTEVQTQAEPMPEVTRHSVDTQEINRIPGTNGDALRSVQNFPGMARTPFGGGDLIIRGSSAADSAVYLAGHEIPALFHFGGLTSVFNSDLVSRIDYLPGNFDERYGDAIGGVVSVTPRKGRRDGFHGYVDADLFDASGLVEGPVGKGSFAASVRRSYIDVLLPVIIPDDAGLAVTAAPRYWDYQASLDYPVGPGTLTARVLGSDDRLGLLFAEDNDVSPGDRSAFSGIQWFHRADLAYEARHDKWTFMFSPSYRRDFFRLRAVDQFFFDVTTDRLSVRGEASRQIGQRSQIRFGTELVNEWIDADVTSPPPPGDTSGGRGGSLSSGGIVNSALARQVTAFRARPALYTTFKVGLHERFSLLPGARLTYYSDPTDRVAFEPRLRFEADLTETTRLRGGVGLFLQGVDIQQNDELFGNPALRPEKALQTSLGVRQEIVDGWSVGVNGYYKHLYSLVSNSPNAIERDGQIIPERYDNAGVGRVYGGEVLVRKDLSDKLFGWVSYTVGRSEVRSRPNEPWALFDFDQTHILTLVASYKLPRNWQIGTRFRFASGNPTTPIANGVTQLYDGLQLPLLGPHNEDRLRPFHQLDLRIDKTWTMRLVRLHTYLDVQNVYNAKNPEQTLYAWNFQRSTTINSLPIIPSLGLKLEW